jgi:hypothetical protein
MFFQFKHGQFSFMKEGLAPRLVYWAPRGAGSEDR